MRKLLFWPNCSMVCVKMNRNLKGNIPQYYIYSNKHPLSNKRPLPLSLGSVRVAERLALPTSDHGVAGSNPAGGEFLPEPKRRFIAQSLSCSSFHCLEMTEILLKGRKTLTHPSIHCHWGKDGQIKQKKSKIWLLWIDISSTEGENL